MNKVRREENVGAYDQTVPRPPEACFKAQATRGWALQAYTQVIRVVMNCFDPIAKSSGPLLRTSPFPKNSTGTQHVDQTSEVQQHIVYSTRSTHRVILLISPELPVALLPPPRTRSIGSTLPRAKMMHREKHDHERGTNGTVRSDRFISNNRAAVPRICRGLKGEGRSTDNTRYTE